MLERFYNQCLSPAIAGFIQNLPMPRISGLQFPKVDFSSLTSFPKDLNRRSCTVILFGVGLVGCVAYVACRLFKNKTDPRLSCDFINLSKNSGRQYAKPESTTIRHFNDAIYYARSLQILNKVDVEDYLNRKDAFIVDGQSIYDLAAALTGRYSDEFISDVFTLVLTKFMKQGHSDTNDLVAFLRPFKAVRTFVPPECCAAIIESIIANNSSDENRIRTLLAIATDFPHLQNALFEEIFKQSPHTVETTVPKRSAGINDEFVQQWDFFRATNLLRSAITCFNQRWIKMPVTERVINFNEFRLLQQGLNILASDSNDSDLKKQEILKIFSSISGRTLPIRIEMNQPSVQHTETFVNNWNKIVQACGETTAKVPPPDLNLLANAEFQENTLVAMKVQQEEKQIVSDAENAKKLQEQEEENERNRLAAENLHQELNAVD